MWGNVQEAVAPRRAILDRYDEISAKLGEPLDERAMEKLCDEMARLQDQIDAENLWELDREIEIAMDVMNLPPGDADVDTLSGGERRRVALCKMLLQKPDLLLLDEPTNHLDAEAVTWLERHLAEYPGTVVAVTHDRYFLDNVARWILELDRGRGIPWEGNYSSWLEQKQDRLGAKRKSRWRGRKRWSANWNGCAWPPRAAGQEQGPHQGLRTDGRARFRRTARRIRNPDSARQTLWATWSSRPRSLCKGYGDTLLIEDLTSACRPAASSASSVPTAPARRRCFA